MKNRNKLFTSIALFGTTLFAVTLASVGISDKLYLKKTSADYTLYHVVLDKNNKLDSSEISGSIATKPVTTSTGVDENAIVFTYNNCQSVSGAHAYMPNGSIISNEKDNSLAFKNQITGIDSITPVFTAEENATLQFSASYDGVNWGSYTEVACAENNVPSFDVSSSKPYYIRLKAVGGGVTLTSLSINYCCIPNSTMSGVPVYECGYTVNDGEGIYFAPADSLDGMFKHIFKGQFFSSGFNVSITMSNNTLKSVKRADMSVYELYDAKGNRRMTNMPFATEGKYYAHIKYGSLPLKIYEINVVNKLIESISIPSTLTLVEEEKSTLTPTFTPADPTIASLDWFSDDETIATVNSSGTVTGVSAGSTTIYAKSTDGTNKFSNNCTVTVSEKPEVPKTFTFDFYDSSKRDSNTGSTFDTDYAQGKLVPSDTSLIGKEDKILLSVENGGTVRYGMNGGLTFGTGKAFGSTTLYFDPQYEITSATIVGTEYDSDATITINGQEADSGELGPFQSTYENAGTLIWNKLNPSSNQITLSSDTNYRATIYTLVLSYSPIAPKPVESINVSLRDQTIYVGGDTKATVTVTPVDADNTSVSWTSEDPSIATVGESGYVLGVSPGTTSIIAKSSENPSIQGSAEITVEAVPVVHVTEVVVNPKTIEVSINGAADLSAQVSPSNATNSSITWSGSANGISVNSETGRVTVSSSAVIGATATIVATSVDNPSKSDSCLVTVVEEASESSATILPSDVGTAYYTEVELLKDSLELEYNDVANFTSNPNTLQFKKASSYIKNTKAISGLKSITLNTKTGSTFVGGLLSGTTSDSLNHEVSVENGNTYNFPNGDTFFKLSAGKNAGYLSSINIVYSTKKVNPTGISIPATKDVGVGTTESLSLTYTPESANQHLNVTWSSNNNAVATVDQNGVVTGVKAGTATITAQLSDSGYTDIKATCLVTVKAISVTGVSLDYTSLSMTIGDESTLVATVSPSNATNKAVSWSSNNNSVATVDNGKITAVSKGTAVITVTTTDGSKTASCNVTVSEEQGAEWTVLVYMCGSDLESKYASSNDGCASNDLYEIATAGSKPSDVNVVVQAGGSTQWSSRYSSVINKNNTNRFHLNESKGYVLDSQTNKSDMSQASTLQNFISWGMQKYPAKKTGLILWNHGGAMSGCCYDDQFNQGRECLQPNEVYTACTQGIPSGKKLEFIGYDACLMSVQDIAGLNSRYANYMIASQELEWGEGWSYDKFMNKVYTHDTTTNILRACVDGYYQDTQAYFGNDNDQTLAYYNLQNFSTYETAWNNFSTQVKKDLAASKYTWTEFTNVVNSAQKYAYDDDPDYDWANHGYCYDVFDVKDFITKAKASSKLKTTLADYLSNLESAFANLNIYSQCGRKAGNSYGLNMFCPLSSYNELAAEGQASNTVFQTWLEICSEKGKWYDKE